MASFGQRWGGSGSPSYWIRVRDREHHDVEIRGGSKVGPHRRRVARWGKWRKVQSGGTRAIGALRVFEDVKRRNPLSEVGVTRKGQTVTVDQLRARAAAEQAEIDGTAEP